MQGEFRRLEDRLAGYEADVAEVIRRVLYEEQRRLGLKSPRDIQNAIEEIVEEVSERDSVGELQP